MQEVIGVLMRNPKILADFDPEWIEDQKDQLVVIAMKGIYKNGIVPTPEIIDREAKLLGIEGLLTYVNGRLDVAHDFSADYVMQAMREAHNTRVQTRMFMDGLRMIKEGVRSDKIDEFIGQTRKKTSSGVRGMQMSMAVDNAMDELKRKYSGETKPFFRTGHEKLDRGLSFYKRMIVMVAAAQKQGKTLWTMDMCQRMLKHSPELSLDYYNFEQSSTEMVMNQIAYETGIDSRIVKGKDRMPTNEEQEIIFKARALLNTYPIKFFNQKMPMSGLRQSILGRADENRIVVIDNAGLIQPELGMMGNAHDDHVAGELVDIRDSANCLIILLHHLSKENENHWNKSDGFEPHQKHIRGSARWADYLNALILLHRPEMYSELESSFGEDWEKVKGYMMVKMPLNRDGSPKIWHWRHQLHIGRFEEMPDINVPSVMR